MEEEKKCYRFVALNAALCFVLALYLAYTRNVDGDEGLYLEAARLVSQGKKLYIDFFFQQMPLIPYLYAAWMQVFGFTLMASRWFSALLTAGSAFFVLWYVAQRSRSLMVICLSSLFLLTSGLFLAWAPVIKTHPFNVFFLTASVVLLLNWKNASAQRPFTMVWVGLLIGLGVNCRLTLAPYGLVFGIFILVFSQKGRFKNFFIYCLGFFLASLPTLYYLLQDPALFLRYNFIFHTKVFPGIAAPEFRLKIARQVFLQPQSGILLVGLYASILIESLKGWKNFLRSDEFFLIIVLGLFAAIHLLTATPFTQYFSAIIPLWILAMLPALMWVIAYPASFRVSLLAPLFLVYVAFMQPLIHFELYSVGSTNPVWKLENINATVKTIQKVLQPDEYCLTWWPGYAFMAGCKSVPGMENHMREHAIHKKIPAKTLIKYKMRTEEQVVEDVDQIRFGVVIDGAYRMNNPLKNYVDYLLPEKYRLVQDQRGVKIYASMEPLVECQEPSKAGIKSLGKGISSRHP